MSDNPLIPSLPLPYHVSKSGAEALYSEEGKKAQKEGRSYTRLQLSADSRLNISAKLLPKGRKRILPLKSKFIKLDEKLHNQKDKDVYVNINSLAKRLNITKEEISKARKENTLNELIQNQTSKQEKILYYYDKVLSTYEKGYATEFEKSDLEACGVSKAVLMKVVTIAVDKLLCPRKEDVGTEKNEKAKKIVVEESVGHKTTENLFIATRKADKLKLFSLGRYWLSREGTVGPVHDAIRLDKTVKERLKLKEGSGSIYRDRTSASHAIKREYEMLSYVHEQNPDPAIPLRGIQEKHRKLIEIGKGENSTRGYLTKAYTSDLEYYMIDGGDKEEKFHIASDLISGLKHLAHCKIHHKDIKTKNILFTKEAPRCKAYIADFDGVTKIDDVNGCYGIRSDGSKVFDMGVHTPTLTSGKHVAAAKLAWERGDIVLSNKIVQENDVFAMGRVLYYLLSGKQTPIQEMSVSDLPVKYMQVTDFNESHLREAKVPEEMITLIKEMVTGEPGKTISIEEVSKRYEQIMSTRVPIE